MYACIGWKPFWILIVLSLFNEWVGFAHFEVGVGCKYLSLAQWIKDAFCPVDVTICLIRWVNYCTLKTKRKKRNAKTQHAVRKRCVSCGDWMFSLCRWQKVYSKKLFFLTHWKSDWEHKKGTFPVFPHSVTIYSGSSPSLGMPAVSWKHFLSGHFNPSLPPRYACQLSEALKLTWHRTVNIYQQPTGANGQSKPIIDQEVMLSQPQDNPIPYNPTCVQLHTCLCSQASDGLNLAHLASLVSASVCSCMGRG